MHLERPLEPVVDIASLFDFKFSPLLLPLRSLIYLLHTLAFSLLRPLLSSTDLPLFSLRRARLGCGQTRVGYEKPSDYARESV
jgi:hypothetical protein